ncbi:MAG: hypothetical protein JNJ57_18995 [Saprospiraceae bacterium]|nr:hypothetical protein [Saprospiraceae bacterium]
MKTLMFILLSSLMVTSGKCSKKETTVRQPMVQLETYGCRGFCPSYKLIFYTDGLVAYEGIRYVVKPGKDSVELTKNELVKLKHALQAVNLWQYPDRIESQIADAPSATLTVFDQEKQHGVYGSMDRPKPILDFEDLLKDLAEAHGLKVKEGVNPYAAPANQKELAVTFKPEINPGNFLMQFQEIRLRIVKRLGAENTWLIGYNPDQVTEKQLIDILIEMEGVLDAKPQK